MRTCSRCLRKACCSHALSRRSNVRSHESQLSDGRGSLTGAAVAGSADCETVVLDSSSVWMNGSTASPLPGLATKGCWLPCRHTEQSATRGLGGGCGWEHVSMGSGSGDSARDAYPEQDHIRCCRTHSVLLTERHELTLGSRARHRSRRCRHERPQLFLWTRTSTGCVPCNLCSTD